VTMDGRFAGVRSARLRNLRCQKGSRVVVSKLLAKVRTFGVKVYLARNPLATARAFIVSCDSSSSEGVLGLFELALTSQSAWKLELSSAPHSTRRSVFDLTFSGESTCIGEDAAARIGSPRGGVIVNRRFLLPKRFEGLAGTSDLLLRPLDEPDDSGKSVGFSSSDSRPGEEKCDPC